MAEPLTHDQLTARLREWLEVAEKATPGLWRITDEDPPRIVATDARVTVIAVTTAPRSNKDNMADAALIALSRTALPAAVQALLKVLELHHSTKIWNDRIDSCIECSADWPCPTVQAITEALNES